jgi:3-deoxy-7-phosphoheptulonate synthase
LTSGLSCPVGLKNGTDGNLKVAIDAVRAAACAHHFLGVTKAGRSAVFATRGNRDCHIILRGGSKPNYDATSVAAACEQLAKAGLPETVMIDFSHANSHKQHERQRDVCHDVAAQISQGEQRIIGVMVESNLIAGRQDIVDGQAPVYGQSVTDACLGWDDTEALLQELASAVVTRRSSAVAVHG